MKQVLAVVAAGHVGVLAIVGPLVATSALVNIPWPGLLVPLWVALGSWMTFRIYKWILLRLAP